jgi:hypothetical protein
VLSIDNTKDIKEVYIEFPNLEFGNGLSRTLIKSSFAVLRPHGDPYKR